VLLDLTPLRTSSGFRGIGKYAHCLGRALQALSSSERKGLHIGALTDLTGADALGALDWPGAPPKEEFQHVRWILRRRSSLVATLRRIRPRVFHATEALGTPRGAGVPRIVTCHDLLKLELHEEYLPGRWVYRRVLHAGEALRYHSADRVIAISEFTANSLMRLTRLPASRIDVIPHGVEHDVFRPARQDDDGEEQRARHGRRAALGVAEHPYLFYVGGADPRKSVATMVAAFDEAALPDHQLVLAGHYSQKERAIVDAALAVSSRVGDVQVLGYVPTEDVVALMDGADALVFPSIGEGFGLPVLEAMALGCPVITTKQTALGEVAGDAALLTRPRDAAELASAMRRVTKEKALRGDLRRAGLARAANFTWKRTALATVDTYARVLA